MERKSILYVLESSGVSIEDMKIFKDKLKEKSFTIDDCDKLLVKLGYEKLFSFDDDFSDDEYGFEEFEPIKHKKTFDE